MSKPIYTVGSAFTCLVDVEHVCFPHEDTWELGGGLSRSSYAYTGLEVSKTVSKVPLFTDTFPDTRSWDRAAN